MAKDWRQIRKARQDVTDYLIHWTRGKIDGHYISEFEVLKSIIACGYLQPSFAPKARRTVGGRENTIRGDIPAVCFSEQPLNAFIQSCRVLPSRYKPYAVAVHKWHLFTYGGRPVIYGDEGMLSALPPEYKYLWARYNPIPEATLGGYPVDWTHEREWRSQAQAYSYGALGVSSPDAVPLLLPPATYPRSKRPVLLLPRFLVNTKAEADELRHWINGLSSNNGEKGVLPYYFANLSNSWIIPLDAVAERLKAGDVRYARLDTLPYNELDPSAELPAPESYIELP